MKWALVFVACFTATVQAQEPVNKWADGVSWGTALVNPTVAVVQAFRSASPKCQIGRIALSEAVLNATSLTMKHFIMSPRPCLGCPPDGMPSGHSGNAMIGSFSWNFGIVFGAGTGALRLEAHRHTPWQVAAGLALGLASEGAGRLIRCAP